MDREQYEKDLEERQRQHLQRIQNAGRPWKPCRHDQCQKCHGTGLTMFGPCIHSLHCDCPKCASYSMCVTGAMTYRTDSSAPSLSNIPKGVAENVFSQGEQNVRSDSTS